MLPTGNLGKPATSLAEEANATGNNSASTISPATQTVAVSEVDIHQAIRELSHDSYLVRQKAADRLLSAGMIARKTLIEISDGSDPETRAAARRLVALIDRTEFHRRLDAFASDTDGRQGLTLPGWEQYQKLAGNDAAARALFVDMQRQEGATLSAVFGVSRRPPEELWEARLQRIAQWPVTAAERNATPPLASCAAMLFIGTVDKMNVADSAVALSLNLIQRPPLHQAMQPGQNETIRRLIAGWILHCPNNSELALRCRMDVMRANALEEGLPLALAIIDGDAAYIRVRPLIKADAILIVGQLGKRKHVSRLEPLLDDTSNCLPMQQPQQRLPGQPPLGVQVRDVALAVLLQLTDQSPADYGFTMARMQSPRVLEISTLYRNNDEQRDEAISKWRNWRAAHKDDTEKAK